MSKIKSLNIAETPKKGEEPIITLIETLRKFDDRLQAIEDKVFANSDGSGTARYENWTQRSDGTEYPGSYGVGPLGSDGQPLKPFVPYSESAPTAVVVPEPYPATGLPPNATEVLSGN
jgi:hypothetical protein